MSVCSAMENAEASPVKRFPLGLDETSEEEYSSLSALLQDFASIPTIDKAWTFTPTRGLSETTSLPLKVGGEVHPVEGTRELSVGQVVWAPASGGLQQYLVFIGWPSDTRKLGIKYYYNWLCVLYAVRAPSSKSEDHQSELIQLKKHLHPDGKVLVFLSAKRSVDSWAHSATQSLHRIDWSIDGKSSPDADIVDVIPVVMCPEDGGFPGLYSVNSLSKPWLFDGFTMILSSFRGSTEVILSVNMLSGKVSRISPGNSSFSWSLLALDGDNIIAGTR
ncbi:hypothetical protein K7X08_010875 [Anisodus acutangulus]|uniref:Acylamino-acid-releasing enzyme N-terminal domain-containing protein n=1 Tax=Anisodus acutangulus TaxID=402998 RepID=A0A9Q1M1P8_9SOLA|nr:hypothetical protein K7X08_010875 [Anisodus acutangulus]